MRTPHEHAVAKTAIRLMQAVVYQETDDEAWRILIHHRSPIRDHFASLGVDVVVDETEGYAYLKTHSDVEGEEPLPRLIRRRSLPYYDSLLVVLLRKRMVEHESRGDEGKLVLTRDELVDMLRLFLPNTTDETKNITKVEASIGRIVNMGFLRPLGATHNTWEVKRILKAHVDAQTLGDFAGKLEHYAAAEESAEATGGTDD